MFGGNRVRFLLFLTRHRREGEWTDGIMCQVLHLHLHLPLHLHLHLHLQATALHLGRNIYIVDTAYCGPGDRGYKVLEGGPAAIARPPLFIGYYTDQHFQSLATTAAPHLLPQVQRRRVTALQARKRELKKQLEELEEQLEELQEQQLEEQGSP